jgi:hypothetical protein
MCLGFVRNFASFVTVRALLGVAEGGLLPGMVRSRPFTLTHVHPTNILSGPLFIALLPP